MPEVFGTDFIETARDKLVTLITALKTTMATGYTPTFTYIYERHDVAKLQLNAVSIGLDSADADDVATGASGNRVYYIMLFTIRVHTDYIGGIRDGQKNERLINSLINKLLNNRKMGASDGYRIGGINSTPVSDISPNEEFSDSATYGGQFTVTVTKDITHTQE